MAEMKEYPSGGNLQKKVQWIVSIDPDDFLKKEQYGQTFKAATDNLKELQAFLISYMEVLERHPDWFEHVPNSLDFVGKHIDRALESNLTIAGAGEIAEICNTALHAQKQIIIKELSQYSAYITSNQSGKTTVTNAEALIKQVESRLNNSQTHIENTLKDSQSRIEGAIKRAQNKSKQIDQILSDATDAVSKSSATKEAVHFQNETKRHHRNALFWLGAVGVVSAALIGTAAYFHFFDAPPIDSAGGFNWNHYVPRFSILALLIFFDAILIGIYKAELHNAIINKHRANALNTFKAMTAATVTQDVKDAVTLTAAGAIYAPQETGYSKRGAAQQINVAEMLANIAANK